MTLNIGVIGIGSAGNQLAKLASEADFDAIAINSTEADLLAIGDACQTMLVGEKGCGKDRSRAKAFVKQKYKPIIEDIKNTLGEHDVIVVAGSTSGGTGSGMIPIMTHLLSSMVKGPVFLNALIIPSIQESAIAQKNTIDCMSEIKDLDLGYFMYDNGTVKGSITEVYKKVNNAFVNDLKVFRGDLCETTVYGIMDDRDRLKLIGTKGLITVSKISGIKESHLDGDINEVIVGSIKGSHNVDIERDRVVKRVGFVHTLPESLLGNVDRYYEKMKNVYGMPMEIFEHINCINDSEAGIVVTIMAGMSYPATRMEDIAESLNSMRENLTRGQKDNLGEIKSSLNWLNDTSDETTIEDIKSDEEVDEASILSMY